MKHAKDPAAMSPEDRLAEIGVILARGYGRSRVTQHSGERARGERNQLATLASHEPSCSRAVNTRENEEVA